MRLFKEVHRGRGGDVVRGMSGPQAMRLSANMEFHNCFVCKGPCEPVGGESWVGMSMMDTPDCVAGDAGSAVEHLVKNWQSCQT